MKTFNLPDLGEGLAEAEIVRWHVNPGDHVKADDPMLAVETAKAIVEVPSPFSGIIKSTHGKPGDMVATGALLVEFEPDPAKSDGAAPGGAVSDAGTVVGRMPTSDADFFEDPAVNGGNPPTPIDAAPQSEHIRAVPAARAVAKRLGIDLTRIRGTGRDGLITVDDVVGASPAHAATPAHTATTAPAPPTTPPSAPWPAHAPTSTPWAPPAAPPTSASSPTAAAQPLTAVPGETEHLRGPRRAMAHSMAIARDSVMGCTLFDDADLNDWQGEQDITIRLLRAIAIACVAQPGLNAWFDGTAQTRRVLTHVDVAIAVDTPEGLIVPVVRDVARRPVAELRRELDRLKRETRNRALKPEELRDFTFMLSNFGMIAGRYATPVVVPPAVAILGSGRLSHDVVATRGGDIAAHVRMPLSLTFDHRCVTGGEAARFTAALIRDLQKGN